MTTDLVLNNLFEGKEVRVIEMDGDVWISTYDLAAAWGIDRTTPHNIIARNYEIFSDVISDGDVTSQTGVCVNERGLYLLMGKITASRLKNPAAKEVIIRFQRWVPELIQKYRKKEIVQVQKEPDYEAALRAVRFAKELAGISQSDPMPLICQALDHHGLGMYGGLLVPKVEQKVLPAPRKPDGYYNATEIGKLCGKSAHQINTWLYQNQYIIKDDAYDWKLTVLGHQFGEERVGEPSKGILIITIYWKPTILPKMNINTIPLIKVE